MQYSEIPTVQSVRTSPAVLTKNPVLATVPKTRLVPRPAGTPNYPALSTAMYTNVNAALAGSTSPSAAMAAAQSPGQQRAQQRDGRPVSLVPLAPGVRACRQAPGPAPQRGDHGQGV